MPNLHTLSRWHATHLENMSIMSTVSPVPNAAGAPSAAVKTDAVATPVDDEVSKLRSGAQPADPQWFAVGIEKRNAALFQAACLPLRPQLAELVRQALTEQDRSENDVDLSVMVDCLIDVAFNKAVEQTATWRDFTREDQVKWVSQFVDDAIESFDAL
jgi:hypothetical protein